MAATRQASGDLIGPYRLEEYLGGGAFGSVWRAVEIATGNAVAIKLLGAVDSVEARSEIELLAATASSTSEHVVRVLAGGMQPVPYIAMEFVEGSDLAESLTERGKLPVSEVIGIGLALADAFVALERVGIVHRDVKPGNVLISNAGEIKLADFGIAKIAGFATVTSTRQAPMTMAYAAPEVWDGHATKASDFYALGCVLYQCLVGAPPFEGGVGELYKAHAERSPNAGALPTNTPASLRTLILKCLAKKPGDRPATADEVLAAMRRAEVEQADIANAVTTSSEPRKFGPWMRREPDASRPWTWYCVHEGTGEQAIVEVHGFATADGGEVLDRAYEHNGELAPMGAERILGRNRLLLRPGEAWLTQPPGEFVFWVARERLELLDGTQLDRPAVASTAANLARMREAASAADLPLELSERTLAFTANGVQVLRPGLPSVPEPVSDGEALAWLLKDQSVEEWPEGFAATSLAGLAAALAAEPSLGVAQAADEGPAGVPAGTEFLTGVATRTTLERAVEPVVVPAVLYPAPAGAPVMPPPEPPRRRRFGLVSFAAFGAAAFGLILGGAAFMMNSGDDTTTTPTPGPTVVPLEIKSVDCTPTTAEVGAPVSCEGTLTGATSGTTYEWAADGGEPAQGTEARFTTAFSTEGERKRLVLKSCDNSGKCVEKSTFVSVNPVGVAPPETAFTCAPNPVRAGEAIACASLATGNGLKWTWDAPGGSNPAGTEQTFSTSFRASKVNDVTLTVCLVVGEKQACATAKQTVLLLEDPTPVQPTATTKASSGGSSNPTPTTVPPPIIASVLCTPPSPKLNQEVTCSANVTGTVDRRTWLASGGSPASGTNSTLVTKYSISGPKTILLEACNGGGCATLSGSVSVSDVPPPVFDLLCRPGTLRTGAPITCTTAVTAGSVTSWSWNAPSGAPSTGAADSFIATYNTYGTKSISATACNASACSTETANFRVLAPWENDTDNPGPAPTSPPEQPAATPTPVATPTPAPGATSAPTPTKTPTPMPGATNTPTILPTATPTSKPAITNSLSVSRISDPYGITFQVGYTYDGSQGFWGTSPVHPSIWPVVTASTPSSAGNTIPNSSMGMTANSGSVTWRNLIEDDSCTAPLDVSLTITLKFQMQYDGGGVLAETGFQTVTSIVRKMRYVGAGVMEGCP